jgi:ectoine hydroxylase-related dioxygenase (phytanoyl-CoA dioxygenase family)
MSPTIDINFLKEYGYCVVEGGVSPHLIKAYKDKYPDELTRSVEPFLSYLPSREEYLENQTILNITFNDMMQQYFASTGATYSLHLSEARLGSSNINWHRDFNPNLEVDKFNGTVESGEHYLGMMTCIDDFGAGSGPFEVVPGSHKWIIDRAVINYENMMNNPAKCYAYYELLIDELKNNTGITPYQFRGKSGDVIVWYGSSVHRGAQASSAFPANERFRNSLIGHYSAVPLSEIQNSHGADKKDKKYLRVKAANNCYQTIHDNQRQI